LESKEIAAKILKDGRVIVKSPRDSVTRVSVSSIFLEISSPGPNRLAQRDLKSSPFHIRFPNDEYMYSTGES
jgi:hypothetical protein